MICTGELYAKLECFLVFHSIVQCVIATGHCKIHIRSKLTLLCFLLRRAAKRSVWRADQTILFPFWHVWHFSLKACLMRRWRILTISPGYIHGNYFCWGFTASFIACIWTQNSSAALTARCCCGTLNTIEPLFTATARSCVVSTSTANFSSLIDGCLKYKNK